MTRLEAIDHYTKMYLIAQSSVISERSGKIREDKIALLDKVNADRAAFGLLPMEKEYVGILWDPDEEA